MKALSEQRLPEIAEIEKPKASPLIYVDGRGSVERPVAS